MPLSDAIKNFLEAETQEKQVSSDGAKIVVNEAVGALAFYYEKIRNIIDYQDEHLIRQNAIRRILSRRLILQQEPDGLAEGLLKELVRSRYFKNNTVPLSKATAVEQILRFYLGILHSLQNHKILSDKDHDWLLSMAACAIDEKLVPMAQEEALVRLMYNMTEQHAHRISPDDEERMRSSQMYVTAYRILLRPDINRLRFFLLKSMYPSWQEWRAEDTEQHARDFHEVVRKIDSTVKHPLNRKYMMAFRRFRIPFIILFTILKNNPPSLLDDPAALDKEVKRLCEGFYQVQRRRLYSRTIRAFIYIFLTKMVLGLAIELPYDILTLQHVNTLPLLVNIIFPPALLAFIAFTVKFPGEDNTKSIIQAVREIVYADEKREIFVSQKTGDKKRSFGLDFIFYLLYAVVFFLSFGFVGWVLQKLDFNIVSGVIFFLFFSLITFFGISLRRQVKELIVLKPRVSLATVFLDTFFLPVIQVGRWLSFNISRVNVFVFIFDVLIELPLQALIEITEEWFSFIKEKKDQMDS